MRLEARLRERRASGRKLLVPYVTGGFGDWGAVARAAVDAGADALEIGIPFSDPVMDGVVIQEASRRALADGATPAGIVAEASRLDLDVPIAVMTYYNLVHHAGHVRFARTLADAGIDAAIVPDLPLDELDGWGDAADDAGIETVLLAAPNAADDRLRRVCERSRGFVYGVALMGVTGERTALTAHAASVAARCKAFTDRPVLLGVGISTPAQAVEASDTADGVVVGSAVMRVVVEGEGPEAVDAVAALIARFRTALDATR